MTSILCSFVVFVNSFFNAEIIGKWSFQTDQGTVAVEFKTDNTYLVDFGVDGQIDITGNYTLESDQITLQDISGANMCGEKATYTVKIEGTTLTLTKVKDDCPGRGDLGQMVMTKM
ncbi:MAG: hypothetical protein NW226_04390 [Microscillaceae bacterium]|nr:hypothetical protein [Microscillaceae bacterium]